MKKIKTILAYAWAAMGLPIILITLIGSQPLATGLVNLTGIRISPLQTGGDVVKTVVRDDYSINIYETVFDALIGESKEGFVQIAWQAAGEFPQALDDEVDYDGDGQADFRLQWQAGQEEPLLTAYNEKVLGLEAVYPMDDALVVRVKIAR